MPQLKVNNDYIDSEKKNLLYKDLFKDLNLEKKHSKDYNNHIKFTDNSSDKFNCNIVSQSGFSSNDFVN